jgi:hypothetical protein
MASRRSAPLMPTGAPNPSHQTVALLQREIRYPLKRAFVVVFP